MRKTLPEIGRKKFWYMEAESLAELCPTVTWEAELLSDELGYFF